MQNILEKLYHGNLSVTARTYKRGTEYARVMNQIAEIEEQIKAVLPEKHMTLLGQYAVAQADLVSISCLEDFITGYRMGARFILAALIDDDGCFKPIDE